MRIFRLLLILLLLSGTASAQKKERLKGSKVIAVTQRELKPFNSLEIEDNLEVYFVKGKMPGLEIEADDNVHDAIVAEQNGETIRLFTNKDIVRAKKLSVRITYNDSLKNITAKHNVIINAAAKLELENISVKNLDHSQSFLNVKATNFTLIMDNKAHSEINLQAENSKIQLSENAALKALLASPNINFDMYQKSEAEIEGDVGNLKLRIDNQASFTGKRFTAINLQLIAEAYSNCSIQVNDTATISASGEAEIELYGAPDTVKLDKFANTAVIYKREL